MEFFDCNVSYGIETAHLPLQPVHTAAELCREMRNAGVAKAVVFRAEQYAACPSYGNQLVAEDVSEHLQLFGLWALLPAHTDEIPAPDQMIAAMKRHKIIGFRLFPEDLKFMARVFVLRDWLELAVMHQIPIFINIAHGCSFNELADLLEAYPELTVVLTDPDVWPGDRIQRPFISQFPNVYLDLSYAITDGGVESFVKKYGSSRLLYGSDFPRGYFGSNMLMIKQANLSDADKQNIASDNLKRIVRGVIYD